MYQYKFPQNSQFMYQGCRPKGGRAGGCYLIKKKKKNEKVTRKFQINGTASAIVSGHLWSMEKPSVMAFACVQSVMDSASAHVHLQAQHGPYL